MPRLGVLMAALCAVTMAGSLGVRERPAQAQAAPSPAPAPTSAATDAASPVPPEATPGPGSAAPTASPAADQPGTPPPPPTPAPTQPPIVVDPATGSITPGSTEQFSVMGVLGMISVSVANPAIVDAALDQSSRTLMLTGKAVGSTVVTVRDERGSTRDIPVRVAFAAGNVADGASVRVTGQPASTAFLREQAIETAIAHASVRPGANVVAAEESVTVSRSLAVDDITTIDVPLTITGNAYFPAQGTTRVRVENFAQPAIRPRSLLVSDFPETLKENGILFTADVNAKQAERFLYYHYNPAGQPDRRIVLKVENTSNEPALVQYISGIAGPGTNEMQVGHLSTQRFLARLAQNEGTVVTIPPNSTLALTQQGLPAKTVVSGLLQLHEIAGSPLHLTLVAQDANDSVEGPIPTSALLVGDRPHARGVYPIPEFYFDYSYDTEGPDLEIPIGQIPLPNLVQGQTLAGDYGVLQSVTIRMINNDRRNARQIALYANPRGGRATGTFVIDRILIQAHAMAPFGHYKLRQYTIPPGSFVRTEVVTMPEGGSSYPLRLVVAPDDGSAAPGASDSPIY
ncbi:MAG: pilus assembly protein N-terminal domain-containing protein [Candidatus Eremiobacteraeota bacterium]|nr:pilus assembly protein N-terminal domain-containing protein [Candidatus Eremiobacteraeota bacterium]